MNNTRIVLEIPGLSQSALEELFDKTSPEYGFTRELTEGVIAENRHQPAYGIDESTLNAVTIILKLSGEIALSVLANAIYDWLKGKVEEFYLNDYEVSTDPDEISAAIEESAAEGEDSQE